MPIFPGVLPALKQQQRMDPRAFACSSGLCLGYKSQIVSGETGSDLLINISAQPLLEQMENMKFALCSAELGDSPMDRGWSSGSSVEG
ncbi:hypothetical protein DV515_00013084 [Chloebia gouldiae]|uniref:Uncharacterized protein n=1 Tax=Chloebia gouldiae TaxID=44316 RepID=A0A3L8S210_CHLGU|nr:hypothetical protein DV515_00013084 [Chloebia gouldiae]